MNISTSSSEAMVLNLKKVEYLLQVRENQIEEFKYLLDFTVEGRIEQEIDKQIPQVLS